MQGKKYAYIRVSSKDQNEARQVKEFSEIGIPEKNVIIEKASGKNFNRKEYNRLLNLLKEGDILYIHSIDRIGRDYDGILSEWNRLTKELKVTLKVLDMPLLDSDKKSDNLIDRFTRDMTLLTLAFQAEQELQNIKSRQAMGIAIAKEKGKYKGRQPRTSYSDFEKKIVEQWQCGSLSLNEALKKLGRKKSAFYRLVQKLK